MPKPNIIFVTIDCLRHDFLGSYGRKQSVTPFIDSIANNGTQFNRTYSTGSWTPISFVGLFSSEYLFGLSGAIGIVGNRKSFVEVLQEEGYSTAAFHSNQFLAQRYGYNKGFDEFNDIVLPTGKNVVPAPSFWRKAISTITPEFVKKKLRGRVSPDAFTMPYVRGKEITEKAVEWIKKPKSKPYFLWIHYMDIHEPTIPLDPIFPKNIDTVEAWKTNQAIRDVNHSFSSKEIEILKQLYDVNLKYIDNLLKELFSVADSDTPRNLLKVITSDHGQAFNEHNFVGHGLELFEELNHVPLIFNGSNIPKQKNNSLSSLIDVAPTLLNAINLAPPSKYEGINLFSDIDDDRTIFCEEGKKALETDGKLMSPGSCFNIDDRSISCMWKNFKYIRRYDNKEYIFDLEKDPHEKINLINEFDKTEVFRKKVAEHESKIEPPPKTESEMTDEETEELKERLKQLGYM